MKSNKILQMFGAYQEAETLEIYIYDTVEGDTTDWTSGKKIKSETSANHIKELLESKKEVSAIKIFINSFGGSVKEGIAIYNQLKRHKAKKQVYIDGYACSIASVIAMCGDTVTMAKNALMMIHNASMYVFGTAEELRKAADDLEVINKASCSTYLERTKGKLSEKELKKMLDEETWLSADECIRYGFADEIQQDNNTAETPSQCAYRNYVIKMVARQSATPKQSNDGKNPFSAFFKNI